MNTAVEQLDQFIPFHRQLPTEEAEMRADGCGPKSRTTAFCAGVRWSLVINVTERRRVHPLAVVGLPARRAEA